MSESVSPSVSNMMLDPLVNSTSLLTSVASLFVKGRSNCQGGFRDVEGNPGMPNGCVIIPFAVGDHIHCFLLYMVFRKL